MSAAPTMGITTVAPGPEASAGLEGRRTGGGGTVEGLRARGGGALGDDEGGGTLGGLRTGGGGAPDDETGSPGGSLLGGGGMAGDRVTTGGGEMLGGRWGGGTTTGFCPGGGGRRLPGACEDGAGLEGGAGLDGGIGLDAGVLLDVGLEGGGFPSDADAGPTRSSGGLVGVGRGAPGRGGRGGFAIPGGRKSRRTSAILELPSPIR
ncbi:MAG TPA: hypothetical protein VFB62_23200 [Polyangiaceae bacterium]|nr:hypothetical protein [Polyangiaceae bacterium]